MEDLLAGLEALSVDRCASTRKRRCVQRVDGALSPPSHHHHQQQQPRPPGREPSLAETLASLLRVLQEQADRIARLEEIVASHPEPGAAEAAAAAAAAAAASEREQDRRAADERADRLRRQLSQAQDAVAALEARQAAAAAQDRQRRCRWRLHLDQRQVRRQP